MIPSTKTLLARAYDECIRLNAQCLRLETDNANHRGRIVTLEDHNRHYREIAREASAALARQLRGEPVEGWLDPQPIDPESVTKLKARLNQAKSVSGARYEQLKRERTRRIASDRVARAVFAWAAECSVPPRLWAGDSEQRMLDAMAAWMITK